VKNQHISLVRKDYLLSGSYSAYGRSKLRLSMKAGVNSGSFNHGQHMVAGMEKEHILF